MDNPYKKPCTEDWYWFDETYDEYGPYTTREKAENHLRLYCMVCLDRHSTDAAVDDVAAFHEKFWRPVGKRPGDNWTPEQRQLRADLVLEEALEFVEAMGIDPKEALRTHQETLAKQRVLPDVPGLLPVPDKDDPSLTAVAQYNHSKRVIYGSEHPEPPRTPDLPKAMDAVADLVYVALGAAVTFGVHLGPIWTEVQRTNMAKEGGAVREDGKILKPPGWQPPDVVGILKAEGWDP